MPADDVLGDRQLGRVEAGGDHEHVDLALGPVGRDDRAAGDLRDRVGHEVDVVGGEGGVVVVGDQDALAAEREVRGDLLAQLGVLDPLPDVVERLLLRGSGDLRPQRERRDGDLLRPVDARPVQPLQAGHVAQRLALERAVGAVVARDHPRRGALVDVEAPAGRLQALLELGHDLDGRGAGADDGDPLAGQVDRVVPPGRVEEVALERVDPLDRRHLRRGEASGADDDRAGRPGAGRGADRPALSVLVPPGALDGGVEDEAVEGRRTRSAIFLR